MPRSRNARVDGSPFDAATIAAVWNKGRPIANYDQGVWRHDICGSVLRRDAYGNTQSQRLGGRPHQTGRWRWRGRALQSPAIAVGQQPAQGRHIPVVLLIRAPKRCCSSSAGDALLEGEAQPRAKPMLLTRPRWLASR